MTDIPDYRKSRLINIATTLGLTDDAAALNARKLSGEPFTPDFVQPIQARLDAALAETAVREAANAARDLAFPRRVF